MATSSRRRPSAGPSSGSGPTDGIRRMAAFLFFLISVLVLLIRPVTSGIVLNDFVRHFEPLFYDHHDVRAQHGRSKRESIVGEEDQLRLQFNAHNRLFKIRLRRSAAVFADDVLMESTRGPIPYDLANIYEGELEDDDQSSVSAVLTTDGYLDATVSTASETYYVEPASRYFPGKRNGTEEEFPGVIYKASDVVHPDRDHHESCSSHQFYLKNFEESKGIHEHCANRNRPGMVANAVRCNQSSPAVIRHEDETGSSLLLDENQLIDRTLYSGWDRSQANHGAEHRRSRRKKKKKRSNTINPRKTTCMLYLQADHLFYAKMGSEEACIETMTRHVQRVNSIYKNIDFDGDGQPDEINFMIKRIKVHTEQALNEASYRFPGNYGVEKFLELFSEEDYNAFCLAYMFTYRDFEGGTLGLAWTGDLKNAGGVCEKNGHYRGSLKSLNTGIVTLLNYGKHVPPAVSHVTLAHEIGHNFGSPHDPENNRDCTPGGEDGNYIMFARATSGDKRNNNKFSPCSLKSINGVLSTKARNDHGCFTEPQSAICGNGVVEAGEECDCGWEEDCKEKCCYPMRSTSLPGEKPCTLRPMRACSPSQGPCCTEDCQLRYGVKCRDDNGCRDSAYCDGTGPKCPASNNKPNKTVCNEEFVCFMGECTGSICIAYGLQSCQCLQGPNDPPTKACELCCKLPGDDQPCLSSFEWNSPPYDVPDAHAKAGTPCNNYNGYCDVFQRCREVDPSGPLATLRRLLLSDESIASLKKWIQDHWYGVLFIAVGFITVIVVIARVFGKRVQKMRHQSRQRASRTTNGLTTAAAAAATAAAVDESPNPHIVHPVAVRTKIPLKRKVREKAGKGKRVKSGNKTYSSASIKALALLRRPHRHQQHRKPRDPAERQRRSGVVSTKEKVRSWLERENPTRETVDSDNESQFPDEEQLERQQEAKENSCNVPSSTAAVEKRHSVDAKVLSSRNSQSNLTMAQTTEQNGPTTSKHKPERKMMRSVSEDVRHLNGRHHFARSISHGAEPDFRGLNRKTESHSHLLSSKSELDLEAKPMDEENGAEINTVSCGAGEKVTHPAVQKQIPKVPVSAGHHHIPKSATESHLVKTATPATDPHQSNHKKRFSSDFLNLLTTRKTSSTSAPPPADKKPRTSRTKEAGASVAAASDDATKKKKIGLGPVKVVLKWHGSGRISSSQPKRAGKPRSPKKKRVIVYKNGNPTAPLPPTCPPQKTELEVEPAKKESIVNITANPLEAIETVVSKRHPTPDKAVRPSTNGDVVVSRSPRRYSVQERQLPPTLMRRVSEVHHPSSAMISNQKRNRHSWTSACAPEPLPELSAGHIGIHIDDDDDKC